MNYLKWNVDNYRLKKMVQTVKDEIETLGFCQLVENFTRHWPGKPSSIIDHIWTNSPSSFMSTRNIVRSYSDHNLLSSIIRTRDRKEQEHETIRRDRKHFSIEKYQEKIKNIDWSDFYCCNEINKLNELFVDKVKGVLDEVAPIKVFQARKNYKNWLSEELKMQMQDRDTKREMARQSGDPTHWRQYRVSRNKCSKNLQKSKN